MTRKGKGHVRDVTNSTAGCAGDQPQPQPQPASNSEGGKLQAVQAREEEGAGSDALTLSVDIVVAVGQRCTSVGEVWALTATCK